MTMAFAAHMMPPMEEAMDMSSPSANQLYDGDIDIDYNYDENAQANDDEHMSEDGQLLRPGTAVTDDLMADADHANMTSVPTIVEEQMQDSDDAAQAPEQQVDDEELIDYDDEIFPNPPQEAPVGDECRTQGPSQMKDGTLEQTADSSFLAPTEALADNGQVDEEIVRRPEDVALEVVGEPKALAADETTAVIAEEPLEHAQAAVRQDIEPSWKEAEVGVQSAVGIVVDATEEQTALPAVDALKAIEASDVANESDEHDAREAEVDQRDASTPVQKVQPRHPGIIDVSADHTTDAPPTPTDLTLHAMLIQYRQYQWPLFKSRSQPDGLLKDDNLLNVSLTDLLNNIRTRLASKVSEADMIIEAEELVLNFDIFGSMIAESSLHASSASLNDVLAIYLTLHKNDGVEEHDTPPLFLTLTTQRDFSRYLDSLKHMAGAGLGLPQIAIEDQYNPPVQNGDDVAEAHQFGHAAYRGPDESDDDHEEYPEIPEDEEHEDQEYQYNEENPAGDEPDHETADCPEGQYQDNGEDDDDDDYYHDETVEQPAETSGTHKDVVEDADPEEPVINSNESIQPTSDASSAVVREPATNDTTGEFTLEDYIDWEDDDLTGESTELHEDDGEDEYSPLMNESVPEAKEATPAAHATADSAEHVPYVDGHTQQDGDDAGSQHNVDEAGTSIDGDTAELPANADDGKTDAADSDDATQAQDTLDEEQYTFDLLDDDGNEPFNDNDEVAGIAHQHELEDDEDDIGFELDDDEPAPVSPAASTPSNKRPYEEPTDEDHIDFDEPETKKARAD